MPSTLYKPKDNHPWRRYPNKKTAGNEEDAVKAPSLKIFLMSLTESWETYSIPTSEEDINSGYQKVCNMSDVKISEWLVGMLRKNWNGKKGATVIYE